AARYASSFRHRTTSYALSREAPLFTASHSCETRGYSPCAPEREAPASLHATHPLFVVALLRTHSPAKHRCSPPLLSCDMRGYSYLRRGWSLALRRVPFRRRTNFGRTLPRSSVFRRASHLREHARLFTLAARLEPRAPASTFSATLRWLRG